MFIRSLVSFWNGFWFLSKQENMDLSPIFPIATQFLVLSFCIRSQRYISSLCRCLESKPLKSSWTWFWCDSNSVHSHIKWIALKRDFTLWKFNTYSKELEKYQRSSWRVIAKRWNSRSYCHETWVPLAAYNKYS